MTEAEKYLANAVQQSSNWKNLTGYPDLNYGGGNEYAGMDLPKGVDTSKLSGRQLKELYGWESLTINVASNTITQATQVDLFDIIHAPGIQQVNGNVNFPDPSGNPANFAIVSAVRDTYVATRNQTYTRAMTCRMVRMIVSNAQDFSQPFAYFKHDSFGIQNNYIFVPNEDFSPFQFQSLRADIPLHSTKNFPDMGLLREDTGFTYTIPVGDTVSFVLFIDRYHSASSNLGHGNTHLQLPK